MQEENTNFLYLYDRARVNGLLRATIPSVEPRDVLREHLIATGKKPADVAREVGWTPQMAGKVLLRQRNISAKHFRPVAAVIGKDLDWLLTHRPTDQTGQSKARSNVPNRADLLRRRKQRRDIEESAQDATRQHDDGALILPSYDDLAVELLSASRVFDAISERARKWHERLADLSSDIAGRQTPASGAAGSAVNEGGRTVRGSDARTRKRRKAG